MLSPCLGLAHQGTTRNIQYFSGGCLVNAGRMLGPFQRVIMDFTSPMLEELDHAAKELNISRQAVIKTLIRQALDQHYLAAAAAHR
jgi:Ribbon-helix-helix protein, copG family